MASLSFSTAAGVWGAAWPPMSRYRRLSVWSGIRRHIEIAMSVGNSPSSNACAHSTGGVIRSAKHPTDRAARSASAGLVVVSWVEVSQRLVPAP